ncbi:DoxX family protein [soil metagenome]
MPSVLAEVILSDNWYDGASAGLLFVRVALGVALAAHGYNKFFGGGKIPGTARWFDSMGMKPNGRIHAVLAASTEMGAGLLFAAGLLTPLAAAGFVGLMVVAGWTVHRPNGFFSAKDGWELNMVFAVAATGVAVVGPGRYSLDWALGLELAFRPGLAFLLSGVLGLVAGVALLATCYRPPADSDDG